MTMPDWQEIDTVLLDMDGTLLDLHFDNYFWLEHVPSKYAEHHGLSEEEALAELNKSFVGLRGTLNWYCLDHWSDLTGLPIAELKRDVQDKIGFRPHVEDFLDTMKQLGKRTVIVTNAHRNSVDLKMERTGL
ncbi:MAG: HAD family hydrolase, partial [Pseudomonadota bacterium]|nr:HAD family hydrolase [Pseudomonadota bacterium]